ncbi:MAG: ubiquinone/menaquinone biosynthesis methyltransferase [Opitutales bacterium]|jgi:demethylmenaquinone methyltransferase/2-methoxy-6-polyprenyl-1,4-benzoquinol methylase
MPESDRVRGIFSAIASRYDLTNRVISCGQDLRWRREVVRLVRARSPKVVVDLATGSGDLAFALRRRLPDETSVSGLDFCEPMLEQARLKQAARPWAGNIRFARGDCMALDLDDASVDVLTIAWGLRNFEDRAKGLAEMRRVLRPGGALYCLEFSQPYRWISRPYFFYLNHVVPPLARALTGSKDAYDYLAGTVEAFPGREELALEMCEAGFSSVRAMPRFFSSVAIHEAIR